MSERISVCRVLFSVAEVKNEANRGMSPSLFGILCEYHYYPVSSVGITVIRYPL